MLPEQESQAVDVAILTAEVAWRVAIEVLRINIDLLLDQGLYHAEVSTDAGDMERGPQVFGTAV